MLYEFSTSFAHVMHNILLSLIHIYRNVIEFKTFARMDGHDPYEIASARRQHSGFFFRGCQEIGEAPRKMRDAARLLLPSKNDLECFEYIARHRLTIASGSLQAIEPSRIFHERMQRLVKAFVTSLDAQRLHKAKRAK